MDSNDKLKAFEKEINYIKSDDLKESLRVLITLIPDYFFTEAASSTGKYHPSFSLGEGGLLRHTKAAVRLAKEILDTETFGDLYTPKERDLLLIAILMHDSVKRGDNEKYTRFDHPLLAGKLVYENKDKAKLSEEDALLLKGMIESHMGQWTKDYDGNEVLPKPKTKLERFVHLCDLLSSKKFLDIKFDKDNNIIEY